MASPLPISLVVEDYLSESVARAVLSQSGRDFLPGPCYCRGGSGYIKKSIPGFNNASKGVSFLVLVDLDRAECAPVLIREWLSVPQNPNLLFRVAVREVESWILADRVAFAKFAGIRVERIPSDVESIDNPKEFLIGLIRRSPRRRLRRDIVPPPGSSRTQGPDYNGRLASFVHDQWNAEKAVNHSDSLRRFLNAVRVFAFRATP